MASPSVVTTGGRPMRVPRPRGPRYLAVATEVSLVPDVMYPWDPAVLRAIREFDRNVIPVWIRKVYRSPDTKGERIIGVHAIASHVAAINRHQEPSKLLYTAITPTHGRTIRPTQLDLVVADRIRDTHNPFGWVYRPFNMRVYRLLRSMYDEWSWKERRRFIEEKGPEAQAAIESQKAAEEDEYIVSHDRRYITRHFEAFDDDDKKRVAAGGAKFEPRPTVDLHVKEKKAS